MNTNYKLLLRSVRAPSPRTVANHPLEAIS